MTHQPSLVCKLQGHERPCLKKQGEQFLRNDTYCWPLASTRMCTPAICMHNCPRGSTCMLTPARMYAQLSSGLHTHVHTCTYVCTVVLGTPHACAHLPICMHSYPQNSICMCTPAHIYVHPCSGAGAPGMISLMPQSESVVSVLASFSTLLGNMGSVLSLRPTQRCADGHEEHRT